MLEHSNPSYQNDIRDLRSVKIGKFGSGGALTSDTCNGANKTRRIIVDQVHESEEDFLKNTTLMTSVF